MSHLLNDMDESLDYMLGLYFVTTPLYNHTTKSLLFRKFKFFKSTHLIVKFLDQTKSTIAYSNIVEIFDLLTLEIDRLYRVQIRSLRITLHNPYTKTIYKLLCLNYLACNTFTPRPPCKGHAQRIIIFLIETIISPLYLIIHISTIILCMLLMPTLIIESYQSCKNIENEEKWAQDILKSRELDIANICNNLNLRIKDLCQKYECKNDFELTLNSHIMRKSCGSDDYVKVWGIYIRDIYDNIHQQPESHARLASIFHDPNNGKNLFKLYNFIYRYNLLN